MPRIAPIALVSLLIASFAHAEMKSPVELTVMTYNIKAGFGGGKERLDPTVGLEKVARIVEQQKPDILFLQEVDRFFKRSHYIDEMDWLKQRLGFDVPAYGAAIQSGTALYGVGILHVAGKRLGGGKYNLFRPNYSESHPDYPDYFSEQRVLLHASARIKGATVDLFCTHLGLTPDQRERQIAQIAEIAGESPHPVIIGGDFNATFDSPEMAPLREAFVDPFTALGLPKERRFSHPDGSKPVNGIDGFFVSGDVQVKDIKVILDDTAASDHNPVVMKVLVEGK